MPPRGDRASARHDAKAAAGAVATVARAASTTKQALAVAGHTRSGRGAGVACWRCNAVRCSAEPCLPAADPGGRGARIRTSGLLVGEFTLHGLLKLSVLNVPAKKKRLGRDPFTGEERMFAAKPASVKIKARALKKLKDAAL